jgi:hemerythrin-like domain-containing protein
MSRAIDTLMSEHQVILNVLGSLENYILQTQQGATLDRDILGDYVEFFRNFADKCHHGKEEELLFSKMNEYGFSNEAGPLAVMLLEHVQGRNHVKALAAIAAGTGLISPADQTQAVQHALGFIPLLRNHISKEDQILYPMAMQYIPTEEMDRLQEAFESFETNVMGADTHAHFHHLADKLVATFPPALDSEASQCAHFCHHS